jgi:hypothetical protein
MPHSPQNLACGVFSKPHPGQLFWSRAPHSVQNAIPSEFSNLQLAQRMLLLYSFGRCGARKTPELTLFDNWPPPAR